jgi:hypothetical protein
LSHLDRLLSSSSSTLFTFSSSSFYLLLIFSRRAPHDNTFLLNHISFSTHGLPHSTNTTFLFRVFNFFRERTEKESRPEIPRKS